MVERARDLHEVLTRAWLLATASSQSVFDAAIAGVPPMTIDIGHRRWVTHVEEGFSIGVEDAESAATAARLLTDETVRAKALARSRSALRARFGKLDGRAAVRAADLI
ncbi:MAG: hypothetical protein ACR2I5_13245 [Candidatus Limnocylindria bacterium]